jgi:hypothetical protein
MASKKTPDTPTGRKPRSTDKTVRRGVGIKSSTWDEVQRISAGEGLTDNAVMRFAIEYFVEQYKAGPAKSALKARKVTRSALS